ncbi:aldo/keto reductase [Saccharopolyspora gregorii]|uniref:Aldo/keto reductase n=1 Tax=Saccharopolyspora gregorii TaxID=33914 RepID=A0ABP6S3G1_9PSEU
MYSTGVAEQIVGKAIADKRDDVLISTKVRMVRGDGPNDAGLSGTTYLAGGGQPAPARHRHIDLYHVHEWDGQTPLEETLEALDTLVRSARSATWGVQLRGLAVLKALGLADRLGYQRFVANQIYYSLESRDAEYELIPASIDRAWACWCGARWPAGCCRQVPARPAGRRRQAPGGGLERATGARCREALRHHRGSGGHRLLAQGVPGADLAGLPAAQAGVTSLVIGARKDEQLRDNLGATEVRLSDDEFRKLDEISKPYLIYPHWHQELSASERFGVPDRALHG